MVEHTPNTPKSHAAFQTDLSDEQLLSRFEVLNVLGKGAYGTVYKAIDHAIEEVVAIKVISLTDQPKDDLESIQKEIGFLAECNHPNVVRYLGSYQHRGELWIVMEYCGGGSVGDLLAASKAPLEEDVIAYICNESLKGLTYLHSFGKVHRDIKCGNILLSETGEVKIADFGVAAQLTNTMSKRHTFIGTPHWMAPEVIQESRYDGKVDVWALGISAIEMAELTPPRWAVHPLRVIFMISRDPPPKLSHPEQWSPIFHDFIAQCLQKEPKMRPTARYLMQHRFVVQLRPDVLSRLQPLVALSQAYLSEVSTPGQPTTKAEMKDLAGVATGQFSWRGGTVPAGRLPEPIPEPSDSPAAIGAHGRGARGKLLGSTPVGLAAGGPGGEFSASTSFDVYDSGTMVVHNQSGTMVVRDSGTMVVHPGANHSASVEAGNFSTMLVSAQEGSGSAQGGMPEEESYLAALQAAAADAQRDRRPRDSSPALVLPMPPIKDDTAKTKERLHALYEGGLVVPMPFLQAAHVQPLALLRPPHAGPGNAGASSMAALASLGTKQAGAVDGIDVRVYEVLLHLVQESAAMAVQASREAVLMPNRLPPHVVKQVLEHPELQNLAQTLAFHYNSQRSLALDKAASIQLQYAIDDLSMTLKCILCL